MKYFTVICLVLLLEILEDGDLILKNWDEGIIVILIIEIIACLIVFISDKVYHYLLSYITDKKISAISFKDFLSDYSSMNVLYSNGKIKCFMFYKQNGEILKVLCSKRLCHYNMQQLRQEKEHLSVLKMKSGKYRIYRLWEDKF